MNIILWVIIAPALLTVIFSKVILSTNFFEEGVAFSIQPMYSDYLKLDCEQPGCNLPMAKSLGIDTFKNMSDLVSFRTSNKNRDNLNQMRNELIKGLDSHLALPSCNQDIGRFAAKTFIKDFQGTDFPPHIRDLLHDLLFLSSSAGNAPILKENTDLLCEKITSTIRQWVVSEVKPTREREVGKLKLVVGFYLALVFIGLFFTLIIPNYRNYKN